MHPLEHQLFLLKNDDEAQHLMRFFKTAPGEYGEGDRFLGVRVPVTRSLVKKYRDTVVIDDVDKLIKSDWHEVRLAGLLLLIEIYRRYKRRNSVDRQRQVVDYYLSVLDRGNNWDLVDLVAPKILGGWIVDNPEYVDILYDLAEMDGCLWHQRVAMVSTWTIIRSGNYAPTLRLAQRFITHKHDLIHKVSGWMLREIGKRGGMDELIYFLDKYAACMPRTMLRYAIEQFPEDKRRHYLSLKTPMHSAQSIPPE